MRLLLLLIGSFLPTISDAFTHSGWKWTRFHTPSNYDRLLSSSSSSIYSTTSNPQLLNEDTDFMIQKNIEFAATEEDDDDNTIVSKSSSTTTTRLPIRFDRVVGPKHTLIYDTTLRGMWNYFYFSCICLSTAYTSSSFVNPMCVCVVV